MRIVLDTNSLLVSIPKRSKYRRIFDALLNGEIRLLLTNEMLNEYTEIIERKMSTVVAINISEFLSQSAFVERVEVYYKWHLIHTDADDNKFVDCAINGNADYIVSDDRHFSKLKQIDFPAVQVIKTAQFLEMLANPAK